MRILVKQQLLTTLSIVILLSVSLSSCKKFLELKPENAITKEDFFKTKDDATAAIVGCYDGLQGTVNQALTWGEIRADLVNFPITNTLYMQNLDKTQSYCNWGQFYNVIGRANLVIEFVPRIPGFDNNFSVADSKKIIGEAKFLRALSYFYLVRTFKEVPLVLQAPSSDDVKYFVPKSPADSILNQIEADLIDADASIPDAYATNIETRGRATKAAVNALQTDVYLWRAKYQLAADAAEKVLAKNTLYQLVPGADWLTIFSQKNSTESVFEVQFDNGINENNGLRGIIGTTSNALIKYFTDEKDLMRGLYNTYTQGNGQWKYNGLTNNITAISRTSNDPNFIVYRLPDVMLMKAEALVHLGSPDQKREAITLIDTIRSRVGLAPYDENKGGFLNGISNTSTMMEIIMRERAMELAHEGKRWFDLVRVATNDNNPDFLINLIVPSRAVGDRSTIRSRIIDPRSWYLPIAQSEIQANNQLVQNPFYR
jgi:starch-binding outer membrane protein, SusD/RagB family